jgi:hypothetical protein
MAITRKATNGMIDRAIKRAAWRKADDDKRRQEAEAIYYQRMKDVMIYMQQRNQQLERYRDEMWRMEQMKRAQHHYGIGLPLGINRIKRP